MKKKSYYITEDINFKDGNYVEKGSEVTFISNDKDFFKVEFLDEDRSIKRIFWINKDKLKNKL